MNLVLRLMGMGALFSLFFAISLKASDSSSKSYDDFFQAGIKAEAAKDWADAIQNYRMALGKQPDSKWPKERMKAIFKALQKTGQNTEALKLLLSPETREEFEKAGYFNAVSASEVGSTGALGSLGSNGLIALGVIIGFALLGFILKGSSLPKAKVKSKQKSVVNAAPPAPSKNAFTSSTQSGFLPKKEVLVTDKTREDIEGIFLSVKSLDEVSEVKAPEKVDVQALQESGVIEAFVASMVSGVQSEDSEFGKFSKMSIDASLLFDDESVEEKASATPQKGPEKS